MVFFNNDFYPSTGFPAILSTKYPWSSGESAQLSAMRRAARGPLIWSNEESSSKSRAFGHALGRQEIGAATWKVFHNYPFDAFFKGWDELIGDNMVM